ncbi:MAG TPA: cation:dicarboxylase symporter family transporter [Bacilli bacterium]|nr:cation:dicarboxylase symporter family transporter [Bacilli bacterium]
MRKISLAWQILIGLLLGILVGAIFYQNPHVSTYLKPIGDLFLHLIKMIVLPIVVSTLVVGVANGGDVKRIGRLGGKTILYFEIITTLAFVIGLLAANLFPVGSGLDMSQLSQGDIGKYVATAQETHSFGGFLVGLVPTNIIRSLAEGQMLAVIFFSVLLGLSVAAIGEKGKPVVSFFQAVADAMFWMTNQIMKVAPFGVFALIGVTVSKFGVASLLPLGKLIVLVYAAMIFFVLVVLGLTAKMVGVNIFSLFKLLKDELLLAYSTASSETVLPRLISKMEAFGCPRAITSFVIPTGYSFNLDGASLYQSLVTVFIAQLFGIDLSIGQQVMIVLTLMLTSKGLAGVPGAAFVVLLATLGSFGLPVEGLALIAGIDRILDMARTAVNVIGNALAAVVISKWEGQFDKSKSEQTMATLQGQGVQV